MGKANNSISTSKTVRGKNLDKIPASAAPGERQWLCFCLNGLQYALEISNIREICPLSSLKPQPVIPSDLDTSMSVYDQNMPVRDLGRLINMERPAYTDENRVIIIDTPNGKAGVIVDQVEAVIRLSDEEVEVNSPQIANINHPVERFIRYDEQVIPILKLEEIVNSINRSLS